MFYIVYIQHHRVISTEIHPADRGVDAVEKSQIREIKVISRFYNNLRIFRKKNCDSFQKNES